MKNSWILRLSSFLIVAILIFVAAAPSPLRVEKGYFMFPINPERTNFLSGSMGELRSNHFHGGLDIKTQGKIGLPIYAAADGFISNISIAPNGYGKMMFITHPNGYVTLYAHIDHFNDDIEAFLIKAHYTKQQFNMDIDLHKDQFPVEKGNIVAYSGNSGSSGGPHLHFEIRDTAENVYNPLSFGFSEVKDALPPSIYKIALKPIGSQSRVEGDIDKQYFSPGFSGGKYQIYNPINVHGQIGLEIKAYDRMNGTYNKYGIQEIQVWVDGERHFEQKIDFYPISLTRQLNLHVDYYDAYYKGEWYHKCYVDAGNALPFYSHDKNRGLINIHDQKAHKVQVFVKDSYNNVSLMELALIGTPINDNKPINRNLLFKPTVKYSLEGSQLRFDVDNVSSDLPVYIYSLYRKKTLKADVFKKDKNVYFYNLNKGIPDSVRIGDSTLILPYKYAIPPSKRVDYNASRLKIRFNQFALGDTLILQHEMTDSSLTINHSMVPVSDYIDIQWRQRDNTKRDSQLYQKFGNRLIFLSKNWQGNTIHFSTRNLGTYVFANDTIAPEVRLIYNTGETMKLRIRDDFSGIDSYNIYVNGEWILMEYDAKYDLLTSKRKPDSPLLRGDCLIEVSDRAGNIKKLSLKL